MNKITRVPRVDWWKKIAIEDLPKDVLVELMEEVLNGDTIPCEHEPRYIKYNIVCPKCNGLGYRPRLRHGYPESVNRWFWHKTF